jgi:hypothetical protein
MPARRTLPARDQTKPERADGIGGYRATRPRLTAAPPRRTIHAEGGRVPGRVRPETAFAALTKGRLTMTVVIGVSTGWVIGLVL